jgi:glycosyltransferase involved in cell wall biosynthesis/GT2 family glycosyltransferase
MNILFVTPESHLQTQPGGIGTYIQYAAGAILAQEGQVRILSWGWEKDLEDLDPAALARLGPENVHWLRVDEALLEGYPGFSYNQAVSEVLAGRIEAICADFAPDVVEGTDYTAPLHAYLERQRAGLLPKRCPVAVFHHGLTQDTWLADGNWPNDVRTLEDFCREENQMHWADTVLCPSAAARGRLLRLGIPPARLHLLREPYAFPPATPIKAPGRHFAHVGRFNFAKGADALIFLLNQMQHSDLVPEEVSILGAPSPGVLRDADFAMTYRRRAHPLVLGNTRFHGSYTRAELGRHLASVHFVCNLSRAETFSYTTVEAVAHQCVPLVPQNSAMAELFPADLHDGLLPGSYPDREEAQAVLRFWLEDYGARLTRLRAHLAQLLAPDTYVHDYETLIGTLSAGQGGNTGAAIPEAAAVSPLQGQQVSVLIAHWNDGERLQSAVASIRDQSWPVGEILILDDGSTDAQSLRSVEELARQAGIRVLHSPNLGLCAARNALIAACRTPWAVFLDSDDLLHPEFTEKTLMTAAFSGADAVIPRRRNFGENADVYCNANANSPFLFVYNNYRMTALIRTEHLQRIGFDPEMRNGEADDWIFWIRFLLSGSGIVTLPESLFLYAFRKGSMSWPWSKGQAILTQARIMETLLTHYPQAASLHRNWIERALRYRALTDASTIFDQSQAIQSPQASDMALLVHVLTRRSSLLRRIYRVRFLRKIGKRLARLILRDRGT